MSGNEFDLPDGVHDSVKTTTALSHHHHHQSNNGNTLHVKGILSNSINGPDMAMHCTFSDAGPVSFLIPVYLAQRPENNNYSQFFYHPVLEECFIGGYGSSREFNKPASFLEYISDESFPPPYPLGIDDSVVSQSYSQSDPSKVALADTDLNVTAVAPKPNIESTPTVNLNDGPPKQDPAIECINKSDIDTSDHQHSKSLQVAKPKFKCEHCSLSFSRYDNLQRHTRNIHLVRRHAISSCSKCGKQIKRYDNLMQHEMMCLGGSNSDVEKEATLRQLYSCKQCTKAYLRKPELTRHISIIHSKVKDLFGCSVCSYVTPYKGLLKRHYHYHHEQHKSLYVCCECDVNFRTGHALTKHRKAKGCPTLDSATCKFCLIRFRTLSILIEHLKSEHSDAVRKFVDTGEDADGDFSSFTVGDFSGNKKKPESVQTPLDILPSMILANVAN